MEINVIRKYEDIGVKLLVGNSSRLSKSDGCIEAQEIEGVKCYEPTFIPKEPWKNLNTKDIDKLITKKKSKFTDIILLRLPRSLRKKYTNLKLANCINLNDILFIENSKEFKTVIQETIKYLSKNNIDNSEITAHAICFGKSNLKNNTFNSKENVYIGMHLDSWEGDLLFMRGYSRNRICLNLGKESRFLLFYNISILNMAKLLDFDFLDPRLDINSIYKEFAKKYGDVPIYKIEIKPFEAYVAPTEFLIHDGSSLNSIFPDINIVFRGRFNFNNFTLTGLIKNIIK